MSSPDPDRRTTSAGYRLPLGKTSTAHRTVSKKVDSGAATSAEKKKAEGCNEVAQNEIWRERVDDEWKGVKEW